MMAVTKEQALTENMFHEEHSEGSRIVRWRRNGKTQVWKTRPDDFRVPIKYGLYSYGEITPDNAHLLHAASECSLEDERC